MAARTSIVAKRPRIEEQYELSDGLPYLLNRVGFRTFAVFEKQLIAENITVSMWRVIMSLARGGAKRIGDLGKQTSLEPSTVSRAVKALERAGCVVRKRSLIDERVVAVTLTATGRAMVHRVLPTALALEKRIIVDLSAAEVATLKSLLARLNTDVNLQDDL